MGGHEGDTCTVVLPGTVNETGITIRLHAIDAPELDQPSGDEACDIAASGSHIPMFVAQFPQVILNAWWDWTMRMSAQGG